jgi:hypothetical protein
MWLLPLTSALTAPVSLDDFHPDGHLCALDSFSQQFFAMWPVLPHPWHCKFLCTIGIFLIAVICLVTSFATLEAHSIERR